MATVTEEDMKGAPETPVNVPPGHLLGAKRHEVLLEVKGRVGKMLDCPKRGNIRGEGCWGGREVTKLDGAVQLRCLWGAEQVPAEQA